MSLQAPVLLRPVYAELWNWRRPGSIRAVGDTDEDRRGGDADHHGSDESRAHIFADDARGQRQRAEHVAELAHLSQSDRNLQGPRAEVAEPRQEPHDQHLAADDHAQEREQPGERSEQVRRVDHRAERDEEHHGEKVTERQEALAGFSRYWALRDREPGDECGERERDTEKRDPTPATSRPLATDTSRKRSCSVWRRRKSHGS